MPTIREQLRWHVRNVRAIDSHSHMGSVRALDVGRELRCVFDVGAAIESYGVFDLLCGCYLYWGIPGQPDKEQVYEQSKKDLVGAFKAVEPFLRKWESTGHWQAIKVALRDLYGFEDEKITAENVERLDEIIKERYGKAYYGWCAQVLERAGVEKSLKMVQPAWLAKVLAGEGKHEQACIEQDLIFPVCSIDGALTGPITTRNTVAERLHETVHMTPLMPDDYRQLVVELFAFLDRANVYGLKNATAYGRDLNFAGTADADFDRWVRDFAKDPKSTWEQSDEARRRIPLNYLMRRVLAEADSRGLPIQMHAGMTRKRNCDPEALLASGCLGDFKGVKFVLLHVYPFEADHALLLRGRPNFYSDLSFLGLSSAHLLEAALTHLVGFASDDRLVIGLDAPSIEEAYGGMVMTRRALENALVHKVEAGYLSLSEAVEIPYKLLRNNAIAIWDLPMEEQWP